MKYKYKVFYNDMEVAEFLTFKEVLMYIAVQVKDDVHDYIDIDKYSIYKLLK